MLQYHRYHLYHQYLNCHQYKRESRYGKSATIASFTNFQLAIFKVTGGELQSTILLIACQPNISLNNTSLKATLKIIHGVICLFCDDKNQNSNPVFCFRPMAHLRPLREMMFSCILHCDLNSLLKIIHSTICLLGDNKNNNNNNNNKNNSDLDCHHNNQSCFLPSVHDHPAQHCDAIPQSSKYSLLLVITIISSIPQSSKFVFSL